MTSHDSRDLDGAMDLTKAVRGAIEGAGLQIESLTVAASPWGDVSQFGFVKSEEDRRRAVDLAEAVDGVGQVLCGIMVS